jgi:hypothetical protein
MSRSPFGPIKIVSLTPTPSPPQKPTPKVFKNIVHNNNKGIII